MIRGLDDDEVQFLESVDRTQISVERRRQLEEAVEMEEFRSKRATLEEKSLDDVCINNYIQFQAFSLL